MIDPMLQEEGHSSLSPRTLRQFAAIWILLFAGLGYWEGYLKDDAVWAIVFGGLAVVPGLVGLLLPAVIRPVFVLLTALTFPIGLLVSQILLAALYYGVLTPVGVVFRLFGRDPLARRFHNDAESYWCAKPQPADVNSYFRQS